MMMMTMMIWTETVRELIRRAEQTPSV